MRAKSIILIVIALGCGLVASIGVSQVLDRKGSGQFSGATEQILVAAIDIDIGKKLDAKNTRLEEWPLGKVDGAIKTLDESSNMFTRTRFYAGEPILSAKLMGSNDTSIAPKIPDGYRVVPVKVDQGEVVGLIEPGDHADVVVFLRKNEDVPQTGAYTILQDVRVFTVNNVADRDTEEKDKSGERVPPKSIALLVKPQQAERIALASEMGKLRITLRHPDDKLIDEAELNRRLPPIFQAGDLSATPVVKEEPKPAVTPAPTVDVTALATTPPPAPTHWQMRIMSPTEVRKFQWDKEGDEPFEIGGVPDPQGGAMAPSNLPEFVPVPPSDPAASRYLGK